MRFIVSLVDSIKASFKSAPVDPWYGATDHYLYQFRDTLDKLPIMLHKVGYSDVRLRFNSEQNCVEVSLSGKTPFLNISTILNALKGRRILVHLSRDANNGIVKELLIRTFPNKKIDFYPFTDYIS